MNIQPIGFLDSGVGGFSVWREVVRQLPGESTIYIGDSLNAPYGRKSRHEIMELSRKLVSFLLSEQSKLIVIACNTITLNCFEGLREEFGEVPMIGVVPVVKLAVQTSKNKRIGVLVTKASAESVFLKELIEKYAGNCLVKVVGTNAIVPLIETAANKKQLRMILEIELKSFLDFGVDTLALGCTHFPLIKKQIAEVAGDGVVLLDSAAAIA